MDQRRPRSRQKNVTGQGTGLGRRGSGLGGGPVGPGNGFGGKNSGGGRITRSAGLSLPVIIIIALVYLFGGDSLEYGRNLYVDSLGYMQKLFCQKCADSVMLDKLEQP